MFKGVIDESKKLIFGAEGCIGSQGQHPYESLGAIHQQK